MQINFIFPPLAEHSVYGPYLAPYLLASVVNKKSDHYANCFDLNILFIRKIIAERKNIHDLIQNKIYEEKEYLNFLTIKCFASLSDTEISFLPTEAIINYIRAFRSLFLEIPHELEKCLNLEFKQEIIIQNFYKEIILQYEIQNADVIGISMPFAEQLPETLHLSKILKKLNPFCKIIIGGNQINLWDDYSIEKLLNYENIDGIAKGDFSIGINKILEEININQEKKIYVSQLFNKGDFVSYPEINFENTESYFSPLTFPVLTGKGCYWGKCTFCDYKKLSFLKDSLFVTRPVSDVFKEIIHIQKKYQNSRIFLVSDALPVKWAEQLCEKFITSGKKMHAKAYLLHSDQLSEQTFNLFEKAGLSTVTFGTEHTSDRVLSLMKKNVNKKTIFENMNAISKFSINTTLNIIPDFPGITKEESDECLNDLKNLSKSFSSLNIQSFELSGNSDLAQEQEKYQISVLKRNIFSKHGYHALLFQDHNLGIEEIKEKKKINIFLSKISNKNEVLLQLHPYLLSFNKNEYTVFSLLKKRLFNISENEYFVLNKISEKTIRTIEFKELSELINNDNSPVKVNSSGFIIKFFQSGLVDI